MPRGIAMLVPLVLSVALSAAGAETQTTVDIVATDASGRALDRLSVVDVVVTEGDVSVPVTELQRVRASGTTDDVQIPPRVVGIFLDEFHVTPGAAADAVRDALLTFVQHTLGPRDLVAVIKPLDSLIDITFTTDKTSAIAEIQSFAPRRGDFAPRTAFERDFIAGTESRIRAARSQIAVSALNALTRAAGQAGTARKTLFVVTEEMPRVGPRRDIPMPGPDGAAAAANRGHVAVYPIDMVTGADATAGRDDSAPSEEEAATQAALTHLATTTSGQVIPRAKVGAGLQQALDEGSDYFVATLASTVSPGDDRLHEIEVTAARAAIHLRARSSYWLPAPLPPPKPPDFGEVAGRSVRRTSPLIETWFGMVQQRSGTTEVSVAWEPASVPPGRGGSRARTPSAPPARVTMSVTALDGARLFDGSLSPSMRATFSAPPGRVLVQLAIEDSSSRVLDHEVRELEIAAYTAKGAINAPEIFRARTVRELKAIRDDPSAAPTTSRRFSRAETLIIRIPVVGEADALPVVQLKTAFGSTLRDLRVTPVDGHDGLYEIELPLTLLASGDYVIDTYASVKGVTLEDRLAFRVTP
ncbi:MAG: VWA domain-containing protein [Acidobacteriaceae bacterium]|jgi:VWFA-related protein|nr:VWA domain-containing protein [Acidobacteriaceae bacterium]